MAEWKGFTDAELKRMQDYGQVSNSPKSKPQAPKIVKPVNRKKVAPSNKSKVNAGKMGAKKVVSDNNGISNDALSKSKASSLTANSISTDGKIASSEKNSPAPHSKTNEQKDCIFDEAAIKEKEKLKLEDVQQRQRQMEERNKRKKEMLTKEIAERKKKAKAESSKLVKIQQELAKLDQLLNFDVSILRDKIDSACFGFSEAQKRFNKAEAEYIAAKMDLHNKTSMKEDLTEHLFNLIQANEERKAKKLEELMHKLDVEEEELEAKASKQDELTSTNLTPSITVAPPCDVSDGSTNTPPCDRSDGKLQTGTVADKTPINSTVDSADCFVPVGCSTGDTLHGEAP